MKSGVNRLQGRNSNFMDFNPDGSTVISSGNTGILINTNDIPTVPVSQPNIPTTTTVIVPNKNKSTSSFDEVFDIIPLTSSISPLDIRPTASLILEDIFATDDIPDEEEFFTLFGIINIELEQVLSETSIGFSDLVDNNLDTSNPVNVSSNINPKRCANIYKNSGGEQKYVRTITSLPELVKAAKDKNINKQIAKSIIAVIKQEQGYKGFNNNLSGTEALCWSGIGPYINGWVVATEGGTKIRKPYASFKTLGDQLQFLVDKFNKKDLVVQDNSQSLLWANKYYKNWNGYGARILWKNNNIFNKDKNTRYKDKFKTQNEFDTYILNNVATLYKEVANQIDKIW